MLKSPKVHFLFKKKFIQITKTVAMVEEKIYQNPANSVKPTVMTRFTKAPRSPIQAHLSICTQPELSFMIQRLKVNFRFIAKL